MKKLVLYVLVILLSLPAFAQKTENLFEQLTGKYADKDGFSASLITKDMFDLYLKKKNIDSESSVYGAIKTLDNIMIISQGNMNSPRYGLVTAGTDVKTEKQEETRNELLETILNHYKTAEYSLFKTEKRMGEDVKVYIKKNQEKVTSLALITSSLSSTNLIELQGDINLAAVAELGSAFNLRGLDNLAKINNTGNNLYYGQNYGNYLPQVNLDVLSELRQNLFSEEQFKKIQEQAQLSAEKQAELAEISRELAEKYRRQPIFLNYPGDSTIYYLNGKKVDAQEIKNIDQESIKSIEVNKSENSGEDKTTIRIKTK